ncbi:MAG TPA: lysophospholipid acyltransferase family protein [Steroidobacteraceae bacterium]|nr:lysophospholipid acyltransferase family protein [Steroidobacteraceae bacterium]
MKERNASDEEPGREGALRNTIYRQITRSGRRMGRLRRALYGLLAPLVVGLVRLWWRSCRIVAVVGEAHLDAVLARAPSFLPCYWHQHQLFCGYYLLQAQQRRRLRVGFLISPSVDGELGAMIIRRVGGVVIRGSSSHTGALALKGYFEALVHEHVSPVINPDGPRGPRFKFKPGAVLLAQLSGRPMLPMAYVASRAWLVHWDRFVLPMPGSRIVIAFGPPREVARVLDAAAVEAITLDMERALHATYQSARAALRATARRPDVSA